MFDADFLQERIDATKTKIAAAEAAEDALISGGISTYSLDTGQSVQKVTRHNLTELRKYVESLYNRLATLEQRRNGSGTRQAVPDF